MNKKIIILIFITILVGIIAYLQNVSIIVKHPEKNFVPIDINEAKSTEDINMALSFLYNITKEKHPTGSEEIYRVRDYITNCLEKMNVKFEVDTQKLNEDFFSYIKEIKLNSLKKLEESQYNKLKTKLHNKDVEKFIKEEMGYNSFEEYYKNEVLQNQNPEEIVSKTYRENLEKYKEETLTNIIVKLNESDNKNAKNIFFVTHYDSVDTSYGAGDAGVGVAGLLEIIRNMKDEKFTNNVYILFTDGEEVGFFGMYNFIRKNNIPIDLAINIDNGGNSGNLVLYHYSDKALSKEYFKSASNEISYSFTNDILYNKDSLYFQGERSDAFVLKEKGYNTIDLALICNPLYYHTEKDNFYNIDVKALENIIKTSEEMMRYFGNEFEECDNVDTVDFKLINGIVLSIEKNLYTTLAVIFIVIDFIYIVMLFRRKEKTIKKIFSILIIIGAIINLYLFKSFSILLSIIIVIEALANFIRNKKIKDITKIVLYESYFFVIAQLLTLVFHYLLITLIIE